MAVRYQPFAILFHDHKGEPGLAAGGHYISGRRVSFFSGMFGNNNYGSTETDLTDRHIGEQPSAVLTNCIEIGLVRHKDILLALPVHSDDVDPIGIVRK